jgi:NAD(P)-dependent dehydrogenase (short-subunit alcohol dehydrogenase family)
MRIAITGVTRGLGRAMLEEFARLGHTVFGCARTPSAIRKLSAEYGQHYFRVVDVASDSQVSGWAASVISVHGPPEIILNNAALFNRRKNLWETTSDEFSEVVQSNISGPVNVIRHYAPSMITARRGIIVNFVSRWAKDTEPRMGAYCATKWALTALTLVLADELKGYGVASIGFNPGVVRTDMLESYMDPALQLAQYPSALDWAKSAVPSILQLRAEDSGRIVDFGIWAK